jgi:hypothetical protein
VGGWHLDVDDRGLGVGVADHGTRCARLATRRPALDRTAEDGVTRGYS